MNSPLPVAENKLLIANSPRYVSFLLALIRLTVTMSYHDCMLKNTDGTNKVMTGMEICITPTDKCIWKYPCDVPNRVKTRSKTMNEPTVGYEEVDKYFTTKYFIHR